MALTLPADLETAQDSQTRRPLVQVITSQKVADIPFDGAELGRGLHTDGSTPINLIDNQSLTMTSGRVAVITGSDAGGDDDLRIQYRVTDTERLQFGEVHTIGLSGNANHHPYSQTMVELPNGNIGVMLLFWSDFSGYWWKLIEVDLIGTLVYNPSSFYGEGKIFMSPITSLVPTPCGYMMMCVKEYEISSGDPLIDSVVEAGDIHYYFYMRTGSEWLETDFQIETEFIIGGLDPTLKVDNPHLTLLSDGELWLYFDVIEEYSIPGDDTSDQKRNIYYAPSVEGDIKTITDITVGTTTVLESVGHLLVHGDVVQFKLFAGADAASINLVWGVVHSVTADTITFNFDLDGLDINDNANTATITTLAFDDAVQVTDFDTFYAKAEDPVAVQKSAGTQHLLYTKIVNALTMDDSYAGWIPTDYVLQTSYDPTNRKLYAVCSYAGVGNKRLRGVVKIDIDTWTVDKSYNGGSTPNFPTWLCYGGGPTPSRSAARGNIRMDENLVAVNTLSGRYVWLLDGDADTITEFYFDTDVTIGTTANMSFDSENMWTAHFDWCQVDKAGGKIWCCIVNGGSGLGEKGFQIGYITIATHDYTIILTETDMNWTRAACVSDDYLGGFHVDEGYIAVTGGTGLANPSFKGSLWIYTTSGNLRHFFDGDADQNYFPYWGLQKPLIHLGKVYAPLADYTTLYDQDNMRGLVEIDIITGTTTFHRPSYTEDNDYGFKYPSVLEEGVIGILDSGNGLAIYNTEDTSWTLWNNSNLPGMTPSGSDSSLFGEVWYDETDNLVMAGQYGGGVFMFNIEGKITTPYYKQANNSGGPWVFGEENKLVVGIDNFSPHATVGPEGAMYVFWRTTSEDDKFILMWDKDGTTIDISKYIVNRDALVAESSIGGNPATLDFTLSHGHMFDPFNLASSLSQLLAKGRKISLSFGEKISYSIIGNTDVYGSAETGAADRIMLSRFYVDFSCTISSIFVYSDTAHPTGNIKGVVYNNNATGDGEPEDLVGEGTNVYGIDAGWNELPFPSPVTIDVAVTVGNMFHLGIWSDSAIKQVYTNPAGSDDYSYYKSIPYGNPSSDPLPDPFGANTSSVNTRSIYAVYDTPAVENLFVDVGEFYVRSTSLNFQRGKYPLMKVHCEDQRALWQHTAIHATPIYTIKADSIIEDILETYANISIGDTNIPDFDDSEILYHQWMDTSIFEIIDQLVSRYSYFFRFDADGKASARKIAIDGSVTNTYLDTSKIFNFSPDDNYSDFTNKVIVEGQENDFTVIYHPEERLARIGGTLGWWGCKEEHQVFYSKDKSREAINPRMEVLKDTALMPFGLGGEASQDLYEDPPAKNYCYIMVDAPNMIDTLLGLIIVDYAGSMAIGNIAPPFGGLTASFGRIWEKLFLMLILDILGSSVNYTIDVYGRPVGQVRRSVQGEWNDLDHQVYLGNVVEVVLKDDLCYSQKDCQDVAGHEGLIVKLQRSRVKFKKVAHLKDEEGDTIQIVHPISGDSIKVFITDLRRSFKKGGSFEDEISGWVL